MQTLRTYYWLTKPGIIYGNLMAATGGFFLAAHSHISLRHFVASMIGLALVIASGCVFNNHMDRQLDQKMARTKRRALVTGRVSGPHALVYATILGSLGTLVLGLFTNLLTLALALFGLFAYVCLYGYGKRHTVHGTVIGSLSGAMPPVIGYTAVTGRFDLAAGLLLVIMICWQMPHFYAIAINRLDDYAAAGLPVLPVKHGIAATKRQIMLYIGVYALIVPLLTILGYTGYTYLGVMVILSLAWLCLGLTGYQASDTKAWARKMFFFSLIVVTSFSLMIAVSAWLP